MIFTYGYLFYIVVNSIYAAAILFSGIRKRKPYPYYLFAVIFGVYMNKAIDLVYFPMIMVEKSEWGEIGNFMDTTLNFMEMGGSYQVLGNIALTVPLGILIPFITDLMPWARRILVLVISALLEVVQLLLIYFAHTVTKFFDIKDIILNVCGGLAGLILFEIFAYFICKVPAEFFEKNKWMSYIYSKRGR